MFVVPAIDAQDVTNIILHPSILLRLQHLSHCVLKFLHDKWLSGQFHVQYASD